VVIVSVDAGSGADQAGLQGTVRDVNGRLVLGDIIQSIDGESVGNLGELGTLLDRYSVGDEVIVTILRDGNSQDVSVQVL
jgi:S1-C subfamily serine protease